MLTKTGTIKIAAKIYIGKFEIWVNQLGKRLGGMNEWLLNVVVFRSVNLIFIISCEKLMGVASLFSLGRPRFNLFRTT